MKIRKKWSKNIKTILNNNFFKRVLIPLTLILLWFSLSLILSSYKSFTVLRYPHLQDDLLNKELDRNKSIRGIFIAREDNLGIVAVKFGVVPKVDYRSEDTIVFRIKEKKQSTWLYENKYRTGAFKANSFYPFGFLPIANSKNKSYVFEIVSLKGDRLNALITGKNNPAYLSLYKFSKNEIFNDYKSIIEFMTKKTYTFFLSYDALISSLIFLLPFLFYVSVSLLNNKKTKLIKLFHLKFKLGANILRNLLIVTTLVLLLSDILFLEELLTGLVLGILGLWILSILINKLSSNTTLLISFLLIVFSAFIIYFRWPISEDKVSDYAYFYIAIGIVQKILEQRFTYFTKTRNKLLV